jgi:cell division protein FtsB
MGNHEYCEGCGASDFHSGQSCAEAYPERRAEKEKERKAKQAIIDREKIRVDKLVQTTLKGGKKAVVARLLAIGVEHVILREKLKTVKAKITKLENENNALGKHCPHPKKYHNDGFMFATCDLCGEQW